MTPSGSNKSMSHYTKTAFDMELTNERIVKMKAESA